jgi:uncharacterized protein with PIN domain
MQIWLRFYEELNDFLPSQIRKRQFAFSLEGDGIVEEVLSSLHVPASQIDLILANGKSVGLAYHLKDGDLLSFYPVFELLDIKPLAQLRPEPLRHMRFLTGPGLRRLAEYLRMCGFDACSFDAPSKEELIRAVKEDRRVIVTKDPVLLHEHRITHGYYVRAIKPRHQLVEILSHLDLFRSIASMSRCISCNGLLRSVCEADSRKEQPQDSNTALPMQCENCGRLHKSGFHFKRMRWFVGRVQKEYECRADASMEGHA